MNKINHKYIFFHALRSALLFIAVFFIYDILINLEKLWNKENPEKSKYNYYLNKIIKLFILYFASIFFNIDF